MVRGEKSREAVLERDFFKGLTLLELLPRNLERSTIALLCYDLQSHPGAILGKNWAASVARVSIAWGTLAYTFMAMARETRLILCRQPTDNDAAARRGDAPLLPRPARLS